MNDEVKRNPTDIQRRGFLAELLCASGRLERADAQLEVILQQDPKTAVTIALLRQLIPRRYGAPRFYAAGRVPEFLDQPPPICQNYVEATIHARENRPAEALRLIERAEEQRPRIKRQLQRQTASKTCATWTTLRPPSSRSDKHRASSVGFPWTACSPSSSASLSGCAILIWRRTAMSVASGPDGEVFLPATYCPGTAEVSEAALLGRVTEWQGGDGAPMRGVGQVCFLAGDDSVSIMDMTTVTIGDGA